MSHFIDMSAREAPQLRIGLVLRAASDEKCGALFRNEHIDDVVCMNNSTRGQK